jgi:hypothetical protein
MKEKSTTQKRAESLIREAQERFPFVDLETIQHICLFRLEGEMFEGDEINEFYYSSVKNWILSYTG